MNYHTKGKVFTQVVSKDPIPATIQTLTHRISGNVHIRRGERLIEELKSTGQFLAITEAKIYSIRGKLLYKSDFMTVNRDHVVWIMPDEEIFEKIESEDV
jgi:hypothetical protein